MEKAKRYSAKREALLQLMRETDVHPTAEWVYQQLKPQFPDLSLGTVYRNLNLLAEEGEILRLTCGDGSDRFDGNPKPHYHFLCNSCGRVIDLDIEPMNHIDVLAAAGFEGTIEGHTVLFNGKCPECKIS